MGEQSGRGPGAAGESAGEGRWTVHKFGGTSLADAPAFRAVAAILKRQPGRRAIVVSAMRGVTDALLDLVRGASSREDGYAADLEALLERQRRVVLELLPDRRGAVLSEALDADVADIRDVLRAMYLTRSRHAADLVSGYGELWSARLLAAFVEAEDRPAVWLDARRVLTVQSGPLAPIVLWDLSRRKLEAWLGGAGSRDVVISGYVAAEEDDTPTTLGRNGSDFSASIFANLLRARSVHIWTDVDGVLSADPRQVPEALVVGELSYHEAMELAYFGAKVIHPGTMGPAIDLGIPIFIRNTFNPEAAGTRIHFRAASELPVKGLASIPGIALVNLEGTNMIGVPGIAERLFGALRQAGVSVVMISQGSSEHSICFAVPAGEAARAREAVERTFFVERHHGQIQTLEVTEDCAVLAVVGDAMAGIPGVAAKFFGSLGSAGINVRAIAQGSSERNISVVIDSRDTTRALRAVHAGFYLSSQALSVGVIGPGLVGATLLEQIEGQRERLKAEHRIDLRVRGLMTRSNMLLDEAGIDLTRWRENLADSPGPGDLRRFADHVKTDSIPHAVIIDCTAADEIARHYPAWLERGIHVITPNKRANTRDLASYETLRRRSRSAGVHYLYETTVGAGLPIIQTLRDLIQTGDEILGIEGVLSGTLSYLFNSFDGSRPFSAILREAKQQGYTEPDPRDDLSGMDVARKVVILAREMGLRVELSDLEIESLVPAELASVPADAFMQQLERLDGPIDQRLQEARQRGEVLRFVGVVRPGGRSSVRLGTYPTTHPFARIQLTDNIVQFRTARYRDNPLVVQGPGAGPDVTAAGVFADLLRLAAYLGATF